MSQDEVDAVASAMAEAHEVDTFRKCFWLFSSSMTWVAAVRSWLVGRWPWYVLFRGVGDIRN